jgi:hypothetical protein
MKMLYPGLDSKFFLKELIAKGENHGKYCTSLPARKRCLPF